MSDDARIQELAEAALDGSRTPDEVCADAPELLAAVVRRLRQVNDLKGNLPILFPANGPSNTPDAFKSPETITGPAAIPGYYIVGVLGEGGMGTVYLAEDVRLGRKAAIKTMKMTRAAQPDNRLRFFREARAAAAVEHDNIVPIWQIGEAADGSPFIAMPFLQGEMLEKRLQREPIQPLPIILKVALDVAQGLAAAHARGLIHRDIKPANVWIEGDPQARDLAQQIQRCKILDFGLARFLATQEEQITPSDAFLGTPAYISPEQAHGDAVDGRADLFSLGVMLYRMATGKLAFAGRTPMAMLTALAIITPPPVDTLNRDLPPALSDLIGQLMQKDPALRPQSAENVARLICQMMQEERDRFATPVDRTPFDARTDRKQLRHVVQTADVAASATARIVERPSSAKRRWIRMAVLVALGFLGLVPMGWWLGSVIFRVETANGTLVVEIDDPETEARIKNGKLILVGPNDKLRYTLIPGERNKQIEAGPYKIHLEGADGLTLDTSEFTLKKGGKVTVRVTQAPLAKSRDADRKAAEWVLSIGGYVQVNGKDLDISKGMHLPPEAFRLTRVDLDMKNVLSDAGLALFKDCTNLTHLSMWGAQVSDAQLACFKNCKDLTELNLAASSISDAGLIHFKDCKNLTVLNLHGAQVTDVGLAYFKDCKNLKVLCLTRTKVDEAGLANFNDCKNLTILSLEGTLVRDGDLVNFKDCKDLMHLHLSDTKVGDAGLINFKDCKNLTELRLSSTQVTDTGLANFEDCKNLTHLFLDRTTVSNVGLTHFKDCKNLTHLSLEHTSVTDAGLTNFKDCKNLTELLLSSTQVGDAGLENFQDCKNLSILDLADTRVTDSGISTLKDLKNLKSLKLQHTKVTTAKVEELRKALPKCAIEWDDDLIDQTGSLADRKAAEWVLSIGGEVRLNGQDRVIKEATNLPPEVFRLTHVKLSGDNQLSDAGLAHFKGCKNLMKLDLYGSQVTDGELAYFKDCANLKVLMLGRTQVGDKGLAHFKRCKNLPELWLFHTRVSDEGLAHFNNCKNLMILHLDNTQVGDAGMANFTVCENLTDLDLSDTQVTNAGLASFKDRKKLRFLLLSNTKVADAGLACFKDCTELQLLRLDGTQVTDAGLTNFKDCTKLTELVLSSTQVGDEGLANFQDCRNLTILDLGGSQVTDMGLSTFKDRKNLKSIKLLQTKVTAAKVEELRKALPGCKIE